MNPDLETRVKQLEGALRFILSDRFVFSKLIQMQDGANVQLATSTGTKIGTDTDQKLGFYGATPRAQHVSHTFASNSNIYGTTQFADNSNENMQREMINAMYQCLFGLGLIREES